VGARGGKRILVLGGGVGGIVTANELRRRLGSEHRVVLVDRRAEYLYTPSLLWMMIGARSRSQVVKDLRRMVRPGVDVLAADVQEIDPAGQRVVTSVGEQGYDFLVVALGADLAPEVMPGYRDVAHNFFDLEGAAGLGEALASFAGGRFAVAISALPYKCPAAPYEAALLIDDLLRRRGVRSRIELDVYTPEPQPMPVAGTVVGGAVRAMLEAQGIRYHPTVQLASVNPERRELVFKDGATAGFDLLAGVPPHRSPRAVRESPLANEAGWVPVDRRKLTTRFENVYAIGDVTTITLSNGKPLPKAGVFAHAEGLAAANAVAAQILGGEAREFDGVGYCWVSKTRDQAGFAIGAFYTEPDPKMDLRKPGRLWHLGKVLFEQYWLGEGPSRVGAQLALRLGSRVLRVPAAL
jgi:sulfide:quinone oxidoreductase